MKPLVIEISGTLERGDVRIQNTAITGKVNLDEVRTAMVGIFQDWARRGQLTRRDELEVLGRILYDAIFNGDVKAELEKKLAQTPDKQRLLIRLQFSEPWSPLATLPWEHLFCKEKDDFL